ncbi:MAG: hypothetical protein U5K00_04230 [Melioribacteraceae bacterium]|nr:hypothetical protein [Melioribacteraceae bacterium]
MLIFQNKNPGDNIKLISLPFPSTFSGMGGMSGTDGKKEMMGGVIMLRLKWVPRLNLFITYKEQSRRQFELPSKLSTLEKPDPQDAVNFNNPLKFVFGMGGHMRWTINNKTFEMNEVADWEKVKLNASEVWEFVNGGGGRGTIMVV